MSDHNIVILGIFIVAAIVLGGLCLFSRKLAKERSLLQTVIALSALCCLILVATILLHPKDVYMIINRRSDAPGSEEVLKRLEKTNVEIQSLARGLYRANASRPIEIDSNVGVSIPLRCRFQIFELSMMSIEAAREAVSRDYLLLRGSDGYLWNLYLSLDEVERADAAFFRVKPDNTSQQDWIVHEIRYCAISRLGSMGLLAQNTTSAIVPFLQHPTLSEPARRAITSFSVEGSKGIKTVISSLSEGMMGEPKKERLKPGGTSSRSSATRSQPQRQAQPARRSESTSGNPWSSRQAYQRPETMPPPVFKEKPRPPGHKQPAAQKTKPPAKAQSKKKNDKKKKLLAPAQPARRASVPDKRAPKVPSMRTTQTKVIRSLGKMETKGAAPLADLAVNLSQNEWKRSKEEKEENDSCGYPLAELDSVNELVAALVQVGPTALEKLFEQMQFSSLLLRTLAYKVALEIGETAADFYPKLLGLAPDNEHIWNRVYLVEIGHDFNEFEGQSQYEILVNHPRFFECNKVKAFEEHYTGLGPEILERVGF